MALFTGSGVAIVTPFKEDGTVDFNTYERLIDELIKQGSDAIVSCGTTGEASTLIDNEQIDVIKCAVNVSAKRVPVIAGAGSNDTAHGKELCIKSEKAGADACLLVTPYYNKTTQKGLIEHFTAQANSIDIPVILYNVPSRTGLNITAETCAKLAKVPNITAIKEASGNITQIAEIAEMCGTELDIYSGNDDEIVPIMSLGGKGVISVLANVAPKQVHDMVMKYLEGDTKSSLKMQLDALPLIKALFSEVNPIPVKAALEFMGYGKAVYRLPLTTMDYSTQEVLKKEMQAYGLI